MYFYFTGSILVGGNEVDLNLKKALKQLPLRISLNLHALHHHLALSLSPNLRLPLVSIKVI